MTGNGSFKQNPSTNVAQRHYLDVSQVTRISQNGVLQTAGIPQLIARQCQLQLAMDTKKAYLRYLSLCAACKFADEGYCHYRQPSSHAHSSSPSGWRFTSRQPMSSGATNSAGRAKKDWGRAGKSLVMGVVAMGVDKKSGGGGVCMLIKCRHKR